uniref:thiol oxidase n=1 Tax=viral metagenome TaxID=1070528 RepID=A0A6C0CPU9_9ZZZZ
MTLDPKIWGPHYWFVLHTIALSYPIKPNETIRKKFYDFYQNLPLFLPIEEIGNNFSKFLDKYPVTPYLESRQSLVRWTHFIHNKINRALNIPTLTMEQAMSAYYESYKPKEVKDLEQRRRREKYVFAGFFVLIIAAAAYLYRK